MPVLATEPTVKRSLELLTPNDWVLLQAGARQMTFAPGEALITEDSPGGTLFLLRSGSAKIIASKVALATIGPGQICGELAFLDKRPSSASVIAEETTEADAIDWAELHRIFRMFPNVAARFYQSLAVMLSRRLRETSSALASARQL